MPVYKHYSFDLWLTLIRSNPLYKKYRSRFFYDNYNTKNKSLPEVEHIFRQVDLMSNAVNEKTGKNIDADELLLMVISLVNDNSFALHEVDINSLCLQMEELALENLPVWYDDSTLDTLACIRQDIGGTISLLSNTGFIRGATLRKILQELNLSQYLDFQLYSDEEGMSKPNKAFFQLMITRVLKLRAIELKEIIHIGDNPIADINGANAAGISSLLINSNDTPITKLITHATQNLFSA